MLKSWSIENFKPIVNSGELKFAPVTVLAGLNSSGKTSLLQSILMIAQTLSNQVADRPLILNGPTVRLGTFEDVLSDFSTTRSITCAFELGEVYEPSEDDVLSTGGLWNYKVKVQFSSANENSASSAIEASKVIINNVAIELMVESGRFTPTGPFDEKFFKHEIKDNFLFKRATENELQQFLDGVAPEYLRMTNYGRERHNYLGECELDENLSDIHFPENVRKEHFQVLATLAHFLPSHLIRKVQNNSPDTSTSESILTTEYLTYLDEAVDKITLFFTSQIRYIGPLRFDPNTTQRQFSSGELDDVGSKGEYAAAVYQANQFAEIEYYNPSTRQIELATLQVALDHWIHYLNVADQIRTETTGISDVIWKVILKPEQNPRVLLDVGFGVSQILPILVSGLLAPRDTLLLIEQPELHLHPRVQARLGDFFVGLSKCSKQCLIETHSENLVNQLRYHIVASGGQEKSDCMIYFVDQDEKGATQFEPVEISPQGNILNWPGGFFDETMHQEDRITAESIKRQIEVIAKVTASEPDFAWNEQPFTQSFALLFTPDDLPPPTDILNLWDMGEKGVRYVIDYWCKHDWQSLVAKPLPYGFSPSFFDSITKYGLASNEIVLTRIIRAAATIIAEKAKDVKSYNLRQLRESEAADSKQRTRVEDNAKAWRLTITPDGVGWRMHYWYIVTAEGGLIEFANILKKHDPEDIY